MSSAVGDRMGGKPFALCAMYGLVLDELDQLSVADRGAIVVGDKPRLPVSCGSMGGLLYSLGTWLARSSPLSSPMDNRLLLFVFGECTYSGGVMAPAPKPTTGEVARDGVLVCISGRREWSSGKACGWSARSSSRP